MILIGYYDMAKKIPAEFRQMILLGNFIWKALPKGDDADMIKLAIFYKNYIDPTNEQIRIENNKILDACQLCLTNILDRFKLLEPYLIQLEKEKNLLEQ